MKTALSILLCSILLLAGRQVYGQPEGTSEPSLATAGSEDYSHLEYFGFYASAMGHWNFTAELAANTNLTWIHVFRDEDWKNSVARMIERVREAEEAGVQAALSIDPFLFIPGEGELRPQDEIESFLVELRAGLEVEGLVSTVAMIYPKDEPFRELINERDPGFIDKHITGDAYREIHLDLFTINSLIKLAFPEKPIGVILSGYELHHTFFSIPENYDWVGFDCYQDLFRSCDKKSFTEHYSHLLDHMQGHQRLIAVPETWAINEYMDRPDWPEVLTERLLHHYEIALSDPRFIAFIPFLWSFDANAATPGLGLNRFPELYDDDIENPGTAFVNQVLGIGEQIKHQARQWPNLAWEDTEDSPHRPASYTFGQFTRTGNDGVVTGWSLNEALPHKNLVMQVIVSDTAGRVVHKSRAVRSLEPVPGLEGLLGLDEPMIGLHGFRYELPSRVFLRSRWQRMNIELVAYEDGGGRIPILIDRQPLNPSPGISPIIAGPGVSASDRQPAGFRPTETR